MEFRIFVIGIYLKFEICDLRLPPPGGKAIRLDTVFDLSDNNCLSLDIASQKSLNLSKGS